MSPIWWTRTSTFPVTTLLSPSLMATRPAAWSISYNLFQETLVSEQPHTNPDARTCAAYHANYGESAPEVTWTGSCEPLTAPPLNSSWPSANSFFLAGTQAAFDNSLPFTPATYSAAVTKAGMLLSVNTVSSLFADLIDADVGATTSRRIEYEVEAVTAAVDMTVNTTTGTTDWTATLRVPAAAPDEAAAHFIRPDELAAYPLVGSMTPGAGTSLSVPLPQSSTTSTTFLQSLYLSSNLEETDIVDLGATSTRFGQWKVLTSSLTVTFRYRWLGTVPPLHLVQRPGGVLDAHAAFARARGTRQSSVPILARGML